MTNHPIQTALCSFGMSGKLFHAPFLHQEPGFHLYGVWERSKNLAAASYPDIRSFRTLESMLEDPAVELVIVNTPNFTHYDYAKAALLAGKHVVVEKPFTITSAEAEELAALAHQQNLVLSVYQNRRYDSDFKTVRKVLEENQLGPVVEAEIHFDRYNPALSAKTHKETPGPGTGVVYDLGSHIIDQAHLLFGMPQAVFADLAITRPHSGIEDYMEILLWYPTLRVRLRSGYFVREPLSAYILHGYLGTFLKHRADIQEGDLQAGLRPDRENWGREPESAAGLLHTQLDGELIRTTVPALQGNYGEYYQGIYQAIRQGFPAPVTAEDGIRTIRIIEAAYRSHREKRIIDL